MRHFLSLTDWTAQEVAGLLSLAEALRSEPAAHRGALAGRTLAMIFQKPSTRTRASFEAGMAQLGGAALHLAAGDLQLGRGETVEDTARVLARYTDAIMARVFDHEMLVRLTVGGVPVINGLSDQEHPCQALADLQTIQQRKGRLDGVSLAYVGDANNVCNSLIHAAALSGVRLRVAAPPGYQPRPDIIAATAGSTRVMVTTDPAEAVKGADAVYTDVWTSMGQEAESAARRKIFAPYRVDEALFARAAPDAIFLHCLPAHRGEEVTAGVIDGARSAVWDQAENRLHTSKALLLTLLGDTAPRAR
jgi:ornithine carbamoyltransferase